MMNHDKKQLEVLLMEYFRRTYTSFPKGVVKPSESPDFIVTFKNQRQLGIELTRLNPGNLALQSPEQIAEIGLQETVINLTNEILEYNLPYRLFVKFLFNEKRKIGKGNEIMLAVKIASAIKNRIEKRNPKSFFSILIHNADLPKEIDNILIMNHPKLKSSVWERSNNLGVSTNVVEDIRNAIQKKDEKIRLYQKKRLNYYWLLIFTDRLRGTRSYNLSEKVKNHKFESRFQYVFLFDLVKSDIYDLF